MVTISRKVSLIIFFVAGGLFIGIGIIALVDSNIPRYVEVSENIESNKTGIFTPDMNSGNIANILLNGSEANILVVDPNSEIIVNKSQDNPIINETFVANTDGKYNIQISNKGNESAHLKLEAYSKASSIAFGGQMMLIITGIIVIGLGLKTRLYT